MRKTGTLLLLFLWICSGAALAQTDTLALDLLKTEGLFLKQNYEILASRYQIEQARAERITAQFFDNPELEYENLFYNHETKKFLQTSYANGQYAGSISQLFKLAGKRNKNIKLAEAGIKLAEYDYFDLMRTLRFELRSTFYSAYFTEQSLKVYDEQIASTTTLLKAYELQLKMGNISTKDLIRLKSLLIGLKSEQTDLLNALEDQYRDLKMLCGISASTNLSLTLNRQELNADLPSALSYSTLLDSARNNRADLKRAKTDLLYQEANLKLQKAMAVPDVEISLSYDLKGNYPEKYTGLGLKIPIPLFNRNQGEIKKARIGIDAATAGIRKQDNLLENEVLNSYKTALRNEKRFTEIDPAFSDDFNKLISGLIQNFKSRNISLIEFLDLYDSYKESTLQLNNLQLDRLRSRAELNYVTGSNIFK